MERMRAPPLAAALVGVIVALGGLGLVYALWLDVLTITATVKTGNVDAEWSFVGCFDIEAKNVGTTTGAIDPADNDLLHFTIENGYPNYTGDCEVEYHYSGSVPARVEKIEFIPGARLTGCGPIAVVPDAPPNPPPTGTFTATCDQLTVKWVNGLCVQLHFSDEAASSLRVDVEQEADQNAQYKFEIRITLVQYNESAC